MKQVITYPDPHLNTLCVEVGFGDDALRLHVHDLWETLKDLEGYGLASPQIGGRARVFVLQYENRKWVMVNPQIVVSTGSELMEESCFSLPRTWGRVTRATSITVTAQDEFGGPFRLDATGKLAQAIQHELDHLDGVLFIDRMGKMARKITLTRQRKHLKLAEKAAVARKAKEKVDMLAKEVQGWEDGTIKPTDEGWEVVDPGSDPPSEAEETEA